MSNNLIVNNVPVYLSRVAGSLHMSPKANDVGAKTAIYLALNSLPGASSKVYDQTKCFCVDKGLKDEADNIRARAGFVSPTQKKTTTIIG